MALTQNENITIYFVQDTTSSNKDMKKAFSACQEAKLKPNIVSEDEIIELPHNSTDVYVIEQFKGESFQFLTSKECLVVGPRCLFSCIKNEIPVPENESPVFSLAMHGIVITASKMSRVQKEELAIIIGYMGGLYTDELTLAVTHVVSDEGRSPKCQKAIEHQIPIMTSEWVRGVWEACSTREVNGADAEFFKYRLPPFKGMYITCSNLPQSTKKKLQAIIEAHGGVYMASLEQNKTVILVIAEPEGRKFQHAQLWDIPCVKPSWIFESAEKGFAVRSADHLVTGKPKCSTPTSELPSFMSNSDISVVPMVQDTSNMAIDETNMSVASTASGCFIKSLPKPKFVKQNLPPKTDISKEYKKFLDQIDMSEVAKAGLFLDGCKIYLSGFTQQETEKLKKVVNRGGATFFTQITDRLSHVIVGGFDIQDCKTLSEISPRPHTVSVEWLLASVREKGVAPVEPYSCLKGGSSSTTLPPSSPLSHKGLELLKSDLGISNNGTTKQITSRKLFPQTSKENNITPEAFPPVPQDDTLNIRAREEIKSLKKLSRMEEQKKSPQEEQPPKKTEAEEENCTTEMSSVDGGNFFEGLTFFVIGFEDQTQVVESIQRVSGKVKSKKFKGKVDYAVLPLITNELSINANEIVTGLWVDDCYENGKLVEVEYFHRPISVKPNEEALSGAAISITGFAGKERNFITHIATALGAIVQDVFSRKDHPAKGIHKSTHLICKSPTGSKYNAAVKWDIPIVEKDWLMATLESGKLQSVNGYLFNQSKPVDTFTTPINPALKRIQATEIKTSVVEATPNTQASSSQLNDNKVPALVAGCKPPVSVLSSEKNEESSPANSTSTNLTPHGIKGLTGKEILSQCTPVQNLSPSELITPETKRKFSFGSVGKSPFHVDTPESPYGRVFLEDGEEPSPSTRKKWKKWIDNLPDLYEGSPDIRAFKKRRPSTPLSIIVKQLWVKFGGAKVEGIDPETGDLLPDGPYKEWAHENDVLKVTQDTTCSENEQEEERLTKRLKADEPVREINDQNKESTFGSPFKPDGNNYFVSPLATPNVFTKSKDVVTAAKDVNESSNKKNKIIYQPSTSWGSDKNVKIDNDDIPSWDFGQPGRLFFGQGVSDTESNVSFPSSSESRKRKINDEEKNTEEKENVAVVSETEEMNEEEEEERKPKEKRIFVLSSIQPSSRGKYESIINNLGGEMSTRQCFDPDSTHLLIEKPFRSEKLMCSIASGKWVLHLSYLTQCYQSRMFLPEEDFEWGNERSRDRLPHLEPGTTEYDLARAAYRWRLQKSHISKPCAFRNFRAILCTSQNKLSQYRRLLEAGGATVLPDSEALKATHVFWDEQTELPVCKSRLTSKKILLLKPIYLGDYLTKIPHPDPKNYSIR